ncbi:MAG: RNA polymerase sigma factor [bacterium]
MESEEITLEEVKRNKVVVNETLYDRYAPVLLSLCLRYCGNQEDAEDVLHDGFIKIIKHIHTFKRRTNGSFEGWMKRIIVNTALNYIRDRSKETQYVAMESIQEPTDDEGNSGMPLDLPGGQLSQEEILQMVLDLPPGYRIVFNLYVFEDYSHREIADLLHMSENTSKSQLSKARALLRKQILERIKKPTFA